MKNSRIFQIVEILTAQVQDRKTRKSDNRGKDSGEKLRENRCPGSTRNAHMHRNDKDDVEYNVEYG